MKRSVVTLVLAVGMFQTALSAAADMTRGSAVEEPVDEQVQEPTVLTQEELEAIEAVEAFKNLHPEPKRTGPSPYALVNDKDPEATVPLELQRTNPMAFAYYYMELADKADVAFNEKRYDDAVKFQRAMIKSTPEDAVGYRKLCATYVELGDRPKALENCSEALSRAGTVMDDFIRYVDLAMGPRGPVAPSTREEIDAVLTHLEAQPLGQLTAAQLNCKLGARLEDPLRLDRCVKTLTAAAPDDPITLTYAFALAVARNDRSAAESLASRAEQLQLPAEVVQQMRDFTQARLGLPTKTWVAIAGLGTVLLGGVSWLWARRRRSGRHGSARPAHA